ncbi:uncharacterized protein LOC123564714 [Mercenaria mercenaria]|uniref:uncharacterized protein LOC123564714 n=1 Tax=Mercenaria mercenaria TaxID=6596 RepID=UPI00234F3007|nr:uncharacterized protein LOC123564714 [Mercenaria mercenaria]
MHLLVALVLLPIVLGSAIPGQDKCVWGPPYWCSSVKHARECGATKHCLQTVWKNQIIKPESTATCSYCELIVDAFRDALENKATQAQVAAVLANVCAILPDSDTRDMCQEIVKEYVPELVQMFEDDITTDMICATLGLCSGLEDRWSPYGIKAGNNTDCSDCTKFFKDVQDSITSNETLNQLLQLLNQTVCSQLGAFSDTCMDLARQYLPVALQTLADQIDPDIVCRVFGFCTTDSVQGDVIKIKNIFSERTSKDALKYRSSEECVICQDFVKEVNTLMEDPSEQDKLVNEIKNVFCSKTGDFQIQCKHIMDGYVPTLVKLLANKLQMDPVITCKVVGLCSSDKVKVDVVQMMNSMFTVRKSKAVVGFKSSDEECDICKDLVTQIDDLVKDKTNQDKFMYEVENYVCPKLGTLQDECKQLVEEYAPALFELLVNELDPKTLCEEVGFCTVPSLPKVTEAKQVEPAGMVGSGYVEKSMECTLCSLIMEEVDNLLKQNETVITIEDLLDKVCKRLPTKELDKHCEEFISKYGPRVINLLAKEKVCEEIGVCPKSAVSVLRQQKVGDGKCDLCTFFFTTVQELIANISKEDILKELRAVCQMFPGNFSATCLTYLDQYGPIVIDLLKTNPKSLCELAGACTESHVPYMTKPIPENLPSVKGPSVKCDFCDTAVTVLKSYLAMKATRAELEMGLNALCKYVPDLTPVCQSLIAAYGDKIIAWIDSELNAKEICDKVGLCKAVKKQTPVVSVIMSPYDTLPLGKSLENKKAAVSIPSEECKVCDTVVIMLKFMLRNNQTEEEIKKALETVCSYLPSEVTDLCQDVVKQYGKKIIEFIDSELNATEICTKVGLCQAVRKQTSAVSVAMSPYDTLPLVQPLESKKVVKSDEKCELCDEGIKMLKSFISENATKKEIKKEVESFCKKVPEAFEQECDSIIEQYGGKIIDLLVKKVDAHQICVDIGLCDKVLSISEVMSPYDSLPIVQQVSEKKESESVGNEVECEACKYIMTYLDKELQKNRTEENIKAALKEICSKLSDQTLTAQCTKLVTKYAQTIINFLLLAESPDKICKELTLCPAGVKKLPEPVHIKLLKDSKETLTSTAAGPFCVICEYVIEKLDDVLKGNRSEAAIKSALDKVCSLLPDTISGECDEFVNQYSNIIIQLLVNEIDPTTICTILSLCSTKTVSPLATLVKILPEKATALDKLKSSGECVICEFVMKELDSILEDNSTQAEIEKALEKVCSLLPSTISAECNAFVKDYGPIVVQLILSRFTPEQVCTAIGLCSSRQQTQWGTFVKILPEKNKDQLKSSPECALCEFVMTELKTLLKENSTEAEIKAALEKVCSLLPETITDQCDAFVEEYADMVVQLILKNFTPEQVCTEIKLCSSRQQSKWSTLITMLSMKQKVKLELCGPCKLIMEELKQFLKQNRTTQEVEEFLKRVCDILPDTVTAQCHQVIDQYIPNILNLIEENVKPEEICQQLGLCNATVTHKKDGSTLFYKPHRLGMNKCTYGPAYWCANKYNAAECNSKIEWVGKNPRVA